MSAPASASRPASSPAASLSARAANRDAYLAKVRHDLRTPINHILGYCEMLLDEAPDPGWLNMVEDLGKIATAGKQLLAIVNYHFDASHARPTVPDLRQIQHEVRTPLNHITGYSEILQEQAAEFGRPVVVSDLGKIRSAAQVLLDLLEAHLIHHQFEKDMASGEAQSMWPAGNATAAPALDLAAPPQWLNATILAVDDDPLNLEMIERRLRRQGCTVITAGSGPQALEMVRTRVPDLILLDMIMPGMDGLQVLANLRSSPTLAQIPVIVLSASDEASTAVHCIKMGADDFLPKPCSTTLLLARLESSLAKKHLRELRLGESGYFHDKGTLRPDAPSYIERKADRDLLDGLLASEPCYVLTSRQMGKSSLMVRTAHRLRERGVSVVVLDLTAIGQNVTADQWYDGMMTRIARALRLEDEMEEFWLRHVRLSPVQRLFTCLRDVGLRQHAHPLVIFIDELDAVRSLPFSSDEFFGAIRECFNRRAEDPVLNRLNFCLLGVADPGDLVRDAQATPFNIARRIELTDFTHEETRQLARGLDRDPAIAEALIERIEHWTHGHPYLTQRICGAIAQDASVTLPAHVDRLCRELFFGVKSREDDDNLAFVRRWLLSPQVETRALLEFYECVRRRGGRLAPDEQDPLLRVLRLSGIVRTEGSRLYVRNRVYARAFDSRWVGAHLAPPGTPVETA